MYGCMDVCNQAHFCLILDPSFSSHKKDSQRERALVPGGLAELWGKIITLSFFRNTDAVFGFGLHVTN